MLLPGSALKSYAIEASDGWIGTVSDFLFDDTTWRLRWMVVDTGNWLPGRKVLIHPSAIARVNYKQQELPVYLTKAQVKDSPDIKQDAPVSLQMQDKLYGYYGWDPSWGGSSLYDGYSGMAGPLMAPRGFQHDPELMDRPPPDVLPEEGDPHLRSIAAVNGSHVHAADGRIGHVENMLMDDATWDIRYLIVDTRDWWFGQHVLVSPFAVRDINWFEHHIHTGLTRDQVKGSPLWDPAAVIDRASELRLHGYYGWPGYDW